MKEHIIGFIKQLEHAVELGEAFTLKPLSAKIKNVLICGLGGSGIGGTIVAKSGLLGASIPITTCNDYHIPEYVNEHTLIVACSYSGNTEETLSALDKGIANNAQVVAVTSGGELKRICDEKGYNYILIPGGNPPRTCIGYSMVEQLYLLASLGVVPQSYIQDVKNAIGLLKANDEAIQAEAKLVAEKLFDKLPVIYGTDKFEPVSIRFRQQLNENSKMLCWHQKFPELNHNEIVGWAEGNEKLAVVLFRNDDDFYRTQERMEFTKKVIIEKGASVTEIFSKGNSFLEKAIYLIYLTDWTSLFIAELKNVDPVEIKVIDALKDYLATVK